MDEKEVDTEFKDVITHLLTHQNNVYGLMTGIYKDMGIRSFNMARGINYLLMRTI